jgi:hypothetical protein
LTYIDDKGVEHEIEGEDSEPNWKHHHDMELEEVETDTDSVEGNDAQEE